MGPLPDAVGGGEHYRPVHTNSRVLVGATGATPLTHAYSDKTPPIPFGGLALWALCVLALLAIVLAMATLFVDSSATFVAAPAGVQLILRLPFISGFDLAANAGGVAAALRTALRDAAAAGLSSAQSPAVALPSVNLVAVNTTANFTAISSTVLTGGDAANLASLSAVQGASRRQRVLQAVSPSPATSPTTAAVPSCDDSQALLVTYPTLESLVLVQVACPADADTASCTARMLASLNASLVLSSSNTSASIFNSLVRHLNNCSDVNVTAAAIVADVQPPVAVAIAPLASPSSSPLVAVSPSSSRTGSHTSTGTQTITATKTGTVTGSSTTTSSATSSFTGSSTVTTTASATTTATSTGTSTTTATNTASASTTASNSRTASETASATVTRTTTASGTPTATHTATATATASGTRSPTSSPPPPPWIDGTGVFACCRSTIDSGANAIVFRAGSSGPYTISNIKIAFMCSYGATCPSTFSVTLKLMSATASGPTSDLVSHTVTANLGAPMVAVFTTFNAASLGSIATTSLASSGYYALAATGASSADYTIPNGNSLATASAGFTYVGNYYTTRSGTSGYWYTQSGYSLLVSIA